MKAGDLRRFWNKTPDVCCGCGTEVRMTQLYTPEQVALLKEKYKKQKIFAIGFGVALLLALIVICVLTNTANAAFNESLAQVIVILGGIALIYYCLNILRATDSEMRHAAMLIEDERGTYEGTFEMEPNDVWIRGSIHIRHILFFTEDGKKRLNIIANKAKELEELSGRVRFETAHSYVAAYEKCGYEEVKNEIY